MTVRLENLTKNIVQTGSKATEQVASSLIKRKIDSKDNSTTATSTLSLAQTRGKPIRIAVGKQVNDRSLKREILSTDDFLKIQLSLKLSQRKTLAIATALRVATKNAKVVEPNLQQKLSVKSHCADKYFNIHKFDFVHVKANKTAAAAEIVVYCTNLEGLIEHVRKTRSLSTFHLKFGIDGGGGFLKVCLSIQSTIENQEHYQRRQKFDDGISVKRFKDSGVNKLLILALAPSSQENYENVSQLWQKLNIDSFEGTIATDLKLANILAGIMTHSSFYPCTWCYASKNELNNCATSRTMGNTLQNYAKWCEAGSVKEDAKKYKNCIHPPVFTTSEDKQLLQIIPPPELHLMLGVVNTLYKHLLTEFEQDALRWAQSCHVTREIRYGNSSFNGNSCKQLLEKVDLLRSRSQNLGCLGYVCAFENFRAVVHACFGCNLDPDFIEKIVAFKDSYLQLNLRITPKVHAVFFHVPEFCEEMQKGLGFYSEQAMESVHADFKSVWNKYKVSKDHPLYANRMHRSVCEYNSLHSF